MSFRDDQNDWLKIMRPLNRDVMLEVWNAPSEGILNTEIASNLSKEDMDILTVLVELEEWNLVESIEDLSMGSPRWFWKPLATPSQVKKGITRKLLVSVFKDWGSDALDALIAELASRPAIVQAIKDAFP